MARVIVIGGHGKVACSRPHPDRARRRGDSVFRNPDHSDDVADTGAKPVVADIERSTPTRWPVAGRHDAVVFSAGAGGGNPARTYAVDRDAAIRVIDAAAQAGVRRFVMVSYFGAGQTTVCRRNSFFPYAEAKAADATCAPATWTGPCWAGPLTLDRRPGGSPSG